MKKMVAIGIAVGLWVSIYVAIQDTIGPMILGALGISIHVEMWPALLTGSAMALLGEGKEGTANYFRMGAVGTLCATLFGVLIRLLSPSLGDIGTLLGLTIAVAVIIIMGPVAPKYFGKGTFMFFCVATVILDDVVAHPIATTITRLAVLFVGGYIFMTVEHLIVGAISRAGTKKEPEEAAH